MKKSTLAIVLMLGAALSASAITTTLEYEDQREAASRAAISNEITTAVGSIPEPDYSTSNAALRATIEATAPAPGNYAAVSNAAMNAATSAEVDSSIDTFRESLTTGEVWPMWAHMADWATEADVAFMLGYFGSGDDPDYFSPRLGQHIVWQLDAATATNATQDSQLGILGGQVSVIGSYLNAEDARFVATNYNSVTHLPEAYVELKLPGGEWSVVWREMTRWNWLIDEYLPTNFYGKSAIDAALADKADRAWGFYDSHSGGYAPDGYTWISSPRIAIAGGLAYQRTLVSEGEIWVLESNGMVAETGGTTNGYFRITDGEGVTQFEIVKGDKRVIGADASSCAVVAGFTPTKLQIGYSVEGAQPKIYVCNSLTTQNWKAEDDSDCLANVSWSGSPGAWVAQVQGKTAQSALFVRATYEAGGETYIRNVAPVGMESIMLNGVKYYLGTATISGHTVLTLSTTAP